jgi:hypothetical protein
MSSRSERPDFFFAPQLGAPGRAVEDRGNEPHRNSMKSPPLFASCYLLTVRGYPHILKIKKAEKPPTPPRSSSGLKTLNRPRLTFDV